MEKILYEVKKIVVGQDHFLERVMVAMLAQGHLLVEGVPGLAKTLTVKTLARTLSGQFKRIQFTPDLVPADLVSSRRCAASPIRWFSTSTPTSTRRTWRCRSRARRRACRNPPCHARCPTRAA